MITCTGDCGRTLPLSEFYTYPTKTKGNRHRKVCKGCSMMITAQTKLMKMMDLDKRIIKCKTCDKYLKQCKGETIEHCLSCRRKQGLTYWYRSENWKKEKLNDKGVWKVNYENKND